MELQDKRIIDKQILAEQEAYTAEIYNDLEDASAKFEDITIEHDEIRLHEKLSAKKQAVVLVQTPETAEQTEADED